MSTQDVATLNAIFFFTFTSVLVVGALRTFVRVIQYRHDGQTIPLILWRDAVFLGGLAIPFAMILASRAFGWAPFLIGNPGWVVATSGPALIGATTYAIFEFLVIDRIEERRTKPREQREPREVREARETPATILEPREPREPRPERPPEEELNGDG